MLVFSEQKRSLVSLNGTDFEYPKRYLRHILVRHDEWVQEYQI